MRRVGITEAPIINLGEPGQEQSFAVATQVAGETPQPGRATTQQMREYFTTPFTPTINQVQRIYLQQSIFPRLQTSQNQPPGNSTIALVTQWEKRPDSLLTGNLNYYTVSGTNIRFTQAGVYRLNINLSAIKRSGNQFFQIEEPLDDSTTHFTRWSNLIQINGAINREIWSGAYTSAFTNLGAPEGFMTASTYAIITSPGNIDIGLRGLNCGDTSAFGVETWEFYGTQVANHNYIEIELIEQTPNQEE